MQLAIEGTPYHRTRSRVEHYVAEWAVDPDPQSKSWLPSIAGADVKGKKVKCSADSRFRLQDMLPGRSYVVALVVHLKEGRPLRSQWVRARTLAQSADDGADDLYSVTRGACLFCPCLSFRLLLEEKFNLNRGVGDTACRKCGCPVNSHEMQGKAVGGWKVKRDAPEQFEVNLPPEARAWNERELGLFLSSKGSFNPTTIAAKYQRSRHSPSCNAVANATSDFRASRVSVVCPTTEARQMFHEQLWSVFDAQTWPDKELIVVDTFSDKPSPFFSKKAEEDRRIVYAPFKVKRDDDLSIGLKRNMCTHLASGRYVANFDDDDLYAPAYITTMVEAMETQGVEAITLGSWFVYEGSTGNFGHVDPKASHGKCDPELADQWLFGYGFSYVFSRDLALRIDYPNCDLGEDFEFFKGVRIRNLWRAREASRKEPVVDKTEAKRSGPCRVWVEEVDLDTMVKLYRNTVTGAVLWEPPPEYTPEDVAAAEEGGTKEEEALDNGIPDLELLDPAGIGLYFDTRGICLHTLHLQSTSGAEDLQTTRVTARCDEDVLEVEHLGEVYDSYRGRFPRTGVSCGFTGLLHAQFQEMRICTSTGKELHIRIRSLTTVDSVRALVAQDLGVREDRISLHHGPLPPGVSPEAGPALSDRSRVGRHTRELWAEVCGG